MKREDLNQLLQESWKHKDKAQAYLATRGLNLFSDVGYIDYYNIDGSTYTNSLVIPVYDLDGQINLLDLKNLTHGEYSKLKCTDVDVAVPIYNLHIAKSGIVTEGILNAESINQYSTTKATALLSASFSSKHMHIVCYCFDTVVLAFDNDTAGVSASNRFIEFRDKYYPTKKIEILDFPYGDLNKALTKLGKAKFVKHIESQIL